MNMTQTFQAQQATSQSDRTNPQRPSFRVLASHELEQYVQEWVELAKAAVTPNPFYEPWTLLAAINHLADRADLRFLLIFGPTPKKGGATPLWGLFPLEIRTRCLGIPFRALAFWEHKHCFLSVPLIHSKHTREVLDIFWRWFERNPFGCRILDTNKLLAEGPLHEMWADFAIGRTSFTVIDFPRACLEPSQSAEFYISGNISKKHHDELLRCERRLAERGRLEYRQIGNSREVETWLDDFIQLEAAGWKGGATGAAFAKEDQQTTYLRTMTREGFSQGRVMLLSLLLDGRPIAMKYNLLSGQGGYTFKIAYDEAFSKYSPGVLLELENIRVVCNNREIKWLDSCAHPRHVMANRIWRERRMIRRTLYSDNSRIGDLFVSSLPLLRWVKKQVRPGNVPSHFKISTQFTSRSEWSTRSEHSR
jgi:CelD/BcsL family acetyltransferase involved in cellulose biosynthesis